METERIPLAVIYKKDGFINIDFTNDASSDYELFGFLKCLVNKMEEELTDTMNSK